MRNDAEEGLSPRAYRLLLTLPGLGFVSGALLFWVSLGVWRAPEIIPIAIIVCLVSWAGGVWASFAAKCPACGKSPYVRRFFKDSNLPFFLNEWHAPWPERRCSRCGLEVGAAPH